MKASVKYMYKISFDVWHTFCIDVSPSSKEDFLNTYLIISNYLDKVKPKISGYFSRREFKSLYIRFIFFDVTSVNVDERVFSFDTDKYEMLMYLQKKLFLEPHKNIKGSPMGLEAILTALNFDDKKRNNTSNYSHYVYRNTIFVITTHETASPSVELSELERDFERDAMCFLIAPKSANWQHYFDTVSNLAWYPGQLSDFVEDFPNEMEAFFGTFAPDI